MAEIDIIAVARVTNGIKLVARGANVANVTMLSVGGDFHFRIIIATLALTFVILVPTGQAIGFFCFIVFEIVSESLFDVFVNL